MTEPINPVNRLGGSEGSRFLPGDLDRRFSSLEDKIGDLSVASGRAFTRGVMRVVSSNPSISITTFSD